MTLVLLIRVSHSRRTVLLGKGEGKGDIYSVHILVTTLKHWECMGGYLHETMCGGSLDQRTST